MSVKQPTATCKRYPPSAPPGCCRGTRPGPCIVSRLDFANVLLLQLRDCLISSLRKVQNAAATMAVRAGRWDQMSPILTRLHWLRIWQRIVYKALVLTSCALHALAPTLDFSSGSPICTWPPPTICRQYGVSCTHIEWRVWWLTLWRGSAKALEFPAPWTQRCQFPVLFWFFFNESSKPICSYQACGPNE